MDGSCPVWLRMDRADGCPRLAPGRDHSAEAPPLQAVVGAGVPTPATAETDLPPAAKNKDGRESCYTTCQRLVSHSGPSTASGLMILPSSNASFFSSDLYLLSIELIEAAENG
jgi:hypothetical protein